MLLEKKTTEKSKTYPACVYPESIITKMGVVSKQNKTKPQSNKTQQQQKKREKHKYSGPERFSREKTFSSGLFGSCVIKDFWERQVEVKSEPFISCLQEQVTGLLPVFHGS